MPECDLAIDEKSDDAQCDDGDNQRKQQFHVTPRLKSVISAGYGSGVAHGRASHVHA